MERFHGSVLRSSHATIGMLRYVRIATLLMHLQSKRQAQSLAVRSLTSACSSVGTQRCRGKHHLTAKLYRRIR